ncbi:MAG: hypothetical protein ACRD5E_09025 [Nitrososphaeraceae archaeon]
MPNHYWKSKEGIEEYRKIGREYDHTVWDIKFEERFKGLDTKKIQTFYNQVYRVKIGDSKEWLVWSATTVAHDGLDNELRFNRAGLGRYPIPQVKYKVQLNELTGEREKKLEGILGMRTGYTTPYSPKNVQKMIDHGYIIDRKLHKGKVEPLLVDLYGELIYSAYYTQQGENGRPKIGVTNLDDFMNKPFDELHIIHPYYGFGSRPSQLPPFSQQDQQKGGQQEQLPRL